MTNTPTKPTILTNGDLDGMDAGELREHLTDVLATVTAGPLRWVDEYCRYADAVACRIMALTGIDSCTIIDEICADVLASIDDEAKS